MSILGDVAELAILLKLKDEVTGPLKNVDRSLMGLHQTSGTVAGGMGKIGTGLAKAAVVGVEAAVGLGAAIGGIAVSATKSASSFQAAMELVHTQAGASQAEVESLSQSVLALAGTTATGPEELAAGLYHIESAGIRGAQALDILKTAALGAQVGNANLESVTNALIAAVNSGIGGTKSFAESMGVLNAIVGAGNMRMQDLTDAFATGLLSTAKAAGISIQSVGAAIADMTNQGVPAIDASTRLRMSISLLAAPTTKAAKLFEGIGLSSSDLANQMRGPQGILGAITDLREHMIKAKLLDANGQVNTAGFDFLSQAFGGGRSSSAIITLVNSFDKLGSIQQQVTAGTGQFAEATAAMQQEVDYKAKQVRASFEAIKIQLGEKLLPVASTVLGALSKGLSDPAVTTGVQQFGDAIAAMFSADNVARAGTFVHDIIPQIGTFATTILPPLVEGLRLAGQVTGQVVGLFMSLPQPLQAAIIGGLVVNKISGGLIGSGLKDIIQALATGAVTSKGGAGSGLASMLGVQRVYVVGGHLDGMGGPGGPSGPGVPTEPGVPPVAPGLFGPGLLPLITAIATPFIMFDVIPKLATDAFHTAGGNELTPGRNAGLSDSTSRTMASLGLNNLLNGPSGSAPVPVNVIGGALTGMGGPGRGGSAVEAALRTNTSEVAGTRRSVEALKASFSRDTDKLDTAIRTSVPRQVAPEVNVNVTVQTNVSVRDTVNATTSLARYGGKVANLLQGQ